MTRKVVPATCRVLGIRPGQIGLINFALTRSRNSPGNHDERLAHEVCFRRGARRRSHGAGRGRIVRAVAATAKGKQRQDDDDAECIPALKPEPTSLWHRLAPLNVGGAMLVLECEEWWACCPRR